MSETEYIDYIFHPAVVKAVDKERKKVTVVVNDEGECGSCPAATLCKAGGKADRTIDIAVADASAYHPGEHVKIIGTEKMHRKAIILSMVIPCIVLLAVMTVIYILTDSQAAAALGALGSTIFFFCLLYLFRDRVRHEFVFTIEPKRKEQESTGEFE